eukprot:scaffold152729_cov27-Tisochrysis_lutea.AAC.2
MARIRSTTLAATPEMPSAEAASIGPSEDSMARASRSACARKVAALAALASRFFLASSSAASRSDGTPAAIASSRIRSSFCALAAFLLR